MHQPQHHGTGIPQRRIPHQKPSSSSSSSFSPPPSSPAAIPAAFTRRKDSILAQLALPDDEYTDLSPKGSVDAGIRTLIAEINALPGFVTTSSCAGRVSVFLEGRRGGMAGELPGHAVAAVEVDDGEGDGEGEGEPRTVAGVGGKGGGGRWLFVSHDAVETRGRLDSEPNIVAALLGMEEPIFDGKEGRRAEEMSDGGSRLIHFKFEPMILHVLTASPEHAQLILRCGLQAGFRESGAINLVPGRDGTTTATPIVAIRSMGLGLESLIGRETNGIKHCTVSGEYLKALIKIANERFAENAKRIERFQACLRDAVAAAEKGGGGRRAKKMMMDGEEWEDAEARRERKRAEGLRRAEDARRAKEEQGQGQQGRETRDETSEPPPVDENAL